MKVLKTKKKHKVPYKRGFIDAIVYLRVEALFINDSGIVSKGEYYYKHKRQDITLDYISENLLKWEVIAQAETQLSATSTTSLKDTIYQRMQEFLLMQLQMEGQENYGIPDTDWEIVK